MDGSWDFEKEPCVIDETLIYNAIISQGPKGEGGKLFKEQGVFYKEVEHLRLDFLDILHIDHLWILTGLTKLQLSNNLIVHITNLDTLVNLRELDLSFNNIAQLENLDSLVNLEVFTVFENKIKKLENMEKLVKLKVFSAGNNKLLDKQTILYLRQFGNLKSLNLTGNPLCQDRNFFQMIYAFLPNLVYYEYRMILDTQKKDAKLLFGSEVATLEEEEALQSQELERLALEQEQNAQAAFVEALGGHHLFNAMFADDPDGNTILLMGDEIYDTYKEYIKNFSSVSQEMYACGLEQHSVRETEIAEYEHSVKQAKEVSFSESRELLEEFLVQKKEMFSKVKVMLDTDEDDEAGMAKLSVKIQQINETFQELCLRTWHTLMQKELHLFEAMEKVNSTLERRLTQQVNELVEAAQASFTQLRTLEAAYHEASVEIADRYITRLTLLLASSKDAGSNISPELLKMMGDKECLANATSASYDVHLHVIDRREDQLVSSARAWLRRFLDHLVSAEVARSRNQIIEMNHFLDSQKQELQNMMATPMGLLMLPTEIQEALQIK